MASCLTISGLVILALAFIACAVSLVAPYWFVSPPFTTGNSVIDTIGRETAEYTGTMEYWGLFAKCNKDHVCTWFFENDFQWEMDRQDWWKAAQGLFAGGVFLVLIAFLTVCMFLCCSCCKTFSIIHCINGMLILAFLALGTGLALFGYYANDAHQVTYDQSKPAYFHWGYWVGCGGALLDLVAIFFYSCEGCRGGSPAGYSRGEVV